ncbi:hypothetical protein R1flu_007345 [Riccia fluitans]|uniref:Uncharacterized protein n=1 Tax=Riccia fluitans TaxID=41844 RepID=A0ABD1YYK2_9MARC
MRCASAGTIAGKSTESSSNSLALSLFLFASGFFVLFPKLTAVAEHRDCQSSSPSVRLVHSGSMLQILKSVQISSLSACSLSSNGDAFIDLYSSSWVDQHA